MKFLALVLVLMAPCNAEVEEVCEPVPVYAPVEVEVLPLGEWVPGDDPWDLIVDR